MSETEQKTCQVVRSRDTWSLSGSGVTCRRPLKAGEQTEAGLCGIHLGAKKRKEANDAAYVARAQARHERNKHGSELAERLLVAGFAATCDGAYSDSQTTLIVMNLEVAEKLLEYLENRDK